MALFGGGPIGKATSGTTGLSGNPSVPMPGQATDPSADRLRQRAAGTSPYYVQGAQRSYDPSAPLVTGYGLFKRSGMASSPPPRVAPPYAPPNPVGAIGSTVNAPVLTEEQAKAKALEDAKRRATEQANASVPKVSAPITVRPPSSILTPKLPTPIAPVAPPPATTAPAEITAPSKGPVLAAPPAGSLQPPPLPSQPMPPKLAPGSPTMPTTPTTSLPSAPASMGSFSGTPSALRALLGGDLSGMPLSPGPVAGMGSLAAPSPTTVANPGNLGPQQATTPQQAAIGFNPITGETNLGESGIVEQVAEDMTRGNEQELRDQAVADLMGNIDPAALGQFVNDFITSYEGQAGTQNPSMQGMLADLLGQAGFDPASLMGDINANWSSAMDPAAWEEMARNRIASADEANLAGLNEAERRINARAARTGLQNTGGQRSSIYNSFADRGVQARRDTFNDALNNQMAAMQGASAFGLGQNAQDQARWAQLLGIGAQGVGADFNAIRADNPSGASVLRDLMGAKAAKDAANTAALGQAGGGVLSALGALLGLGG